MIKQSRTIFCILYLGFFAIANSAFAAESDKILPYFQAQKPLSSTVYTVNGDAYNFGHDDSKIRLVNLWATWCVSCRKEMPMLDALSEQFPPSDLEIITVAVGKNDPEDIDELFTKTGVVNLPVYYDENKQLAAEIGAPSVPFTIFLNAKGEPIARLIGEANYLDPSMASRIQDMIKAQ